MRGPELGLEPRQGARRHRRGDQASDPVVAGVVHHVEQHPGGEAVGQVLDERAAARRAGRTRAGERLGVGADGLHLGVPAHDPEARRRPACGRSARATTPGASRRSRVKASWGKPSANERQVGQVDVVETHAPAPFVAASRHSTTPGRFVLTSVMGQLERVAAQPSLAP